MNTTKALSSVQLRTELNKTDLTRSEKAIIDVLYYYLHTFGQTDFTDEQIAELGGFPSAKAVNNHMKRLDEKGWLIRETTKPVRGCSQRFLKMGDAMANALQAAETPAPQNVGDHPQTVGDHPQNVEPLNSNKHKVTNINHARVKQSGFVDNRTARKRVTAAVMDLANTDW